MKNILKMILASTLFLSTAPACGMSEMDKRMSEKAGMEEVKKKKKKKGKKLSEKGKKKKKGFFSKVFGSK